MNFHFEEKLAIFLSLEFLHKMHDFSFAIQSKFSWHLLLCLFAVQSEDRSFTRIFIIYSVFSFSRMNLKWQIFSNYSMEKKSFPKQYENISFISVQ